MFPRFLLRFFSILCGDPKLILLLFFSIGFFRFFLPSYFVASPSLSIFAFFFIALFRSLIIFPAFFLVVSSSLYFCVAFHRFFKVVNFFTILPSGAPKFVFFCSFSLCFLSCYQFHSQFKFFVGSPSLYVYFVIVFSRSLLYTLVFFFVTILSLILSHFLFAGIFNSFRLEVLALFAS